MRTVYYNGEVYTGQLPLQQAFVVEDGRFLYVGDSQTALKMAGSSEDVFVDLQGKFACSGFIDSHMHLLGFGKMLRQARLDEHTDSLADMIACLKEFAQTEGSDSEWIMGRGWNQDYFTDVDRMPNRYDLDQVSVDRPIYITRACGHSMVVNSKALEILGITEQTLSPEGGSIGMENGVLNGRFDDNAMDLVYDSIAAPGKEELKQIIRTACRYLNAYGITSCQTDDFYAFHNEPWRDILAAYKELEEAGELTVRVYEQSNFTNLNSLKEFVEEGWVTGTGSEQFRIGPLKMLGDGALGARTAFLSVPYADTPDITGIPIFGQETFDEMIGYANSHNMQVAVHCIGDACLDRVLEAFEKALAVYPKEDHRHGIVHCQITRADQLQKICQLKLHVYAQTIFLDYDTHIVDARVGKDLSQTSYRWKTLLKGGATVSNGSDSPVELPDVMAGIQCAVTRKPLKEVRVAPYLPEEAFTVQEALDSYTVFGAYSSFEEEKKGKIQDGMLADFVILEQNPFETDPEKLRNIAVSRTYLGGIPVYQREADK